MEDEAIQQRIIVKDTALKRVIREFVALKRCLGQNERDENEVDLAYAELQRNIEVHEFTVEKLRVLSGTYERELKKYDALFETKQQEIEQTKRDIQNLAVELQSERVARNNKEAYDALGTSIQKLRARADIANEVAQLEQKLQELNDRENALEKQREARERQFSILLHAVADLELALAEPTTKPDNNNNNNNDNEPKTNSSSDSVDRKTNDENGMAVD